MISSTGKIADNQISFYCFLNLKKTELCVSVSLWDYFVKTQK
jgi:hypothetical protein